MTTPPSFRKVNPADQPVLFLALSSATLPLSAVDEYAETMIAPAHLEPARRRPGPGVRRAEIRRARAGRSDRAGGAAASASTRSAAALDAANSNTPVGTLDGPRQSLTLEASGQLTEAAQYRPLIVAYRNGSPVRLGDVATVLDSVENDKIASRFNGTRSIMLAVQRQPDANTVEVVDSVKGAGADASARSCRPRSIST